MTTTLLGANSKLGSILVSHARRAGLKWRTQTRSGAADVIWSGEFEGPAVEKIVQRDSTIINMIGVTSGDTQAMIDANEHFVTRLLHTARHTGVGHVVLMSSAAVYGIADKTPVHENAPLQPITPYGETKANMERIAQLIPIAPSPMAITILRIGNVAGADALFAAAKRHAETRKPMQLHRLPDGTAPVRSYIGPRDLFDAVHALSARHEGPARVVNVAHPQPVRLDAMLQAYKSHLLPDLEWGDAPLPDGVPAVVTLSTDKLDEFVKFPHYNDPADAFVAQMVQAPTL